MELCKGSAATGSHEEGTTVITLYFVSILKFICINNFCVLNHSVGQVSRRDVLRMRIKIFMVRT